MPPRAALPLSHGEHQTPPKQCPVLPPAGGTGVNVKKKKRREENILVINPSSWSLLAFQMCLYLL